MREPSSRRVAVTRDEGTEGALSGALRRYGLEPVAIPVIAHLPAPDLDMLRGLAQRLECFDWVVVASARAVVAMAEARTPLPLGSAREERPRWAAVGDATGSALARYGVTNAIVPAEGNGKALIQALRAADAWPGRRVLVPRAQQGRPEVIAALRAWGAQVTVVSAYVTTPRPRQAIRTAWQAADPAAVVVASPSAARALVEAVGRSALATLRAVVAIGPTTAATLDRLGITACVSPHARFDSAARLSAELLAGAPHRVGP